MRLSPLLAVCFCLALVAPVRPEDDATRVLAKGEKSKDAKKEAKPAKAKESAPSGGGD